MSPSVNHIRQESADVKAIYLVLVIVVVVTALLIVGCGTSGNFPFQGDSSYDSGDSGASSPPATNPPNTGGDTGSTQPPAPPTGGTGDTGGGLQPPAPPIL